MQFKDRIDQALTKASELNEKDAARADKVLRSLQREIQDLTYVIKETEKEREETLMTLTDVMGLLMRKAEEGFKIEALEEMAK